jgi:aspartyl-tRNA(Asn)/glutamyl-tRNA(Gln) amidotransferase subunit B
MMRTKEDAHDYRYFPDPDLLPLHVSDDWIERVKAGLPELPSAKKARFSEQYGLSAYDAGVLTSSKAMSGYFEAAVAAGAEGKATANCLMGEVSATLNRDEKDIADCPIAPASLAGLLKRIADNTISNKIAKEVFAAMWAGEGEADAVIEAKGLKQVTDTGAIEKIIDEVLAANAAMVEEYRSGKEKVFGALVGQAMKASKGKANPAQVNELLKKKLSS